jgi:hypothetical protein
MKRFRANSYEAQLTAEELKTFYELLLRPGLTLDEVVAQSPRWKWGKFKGKMLSHQAASDIYTRLKAELERVANQNADLLDENSKAMEGLIREIKKEEEFDPAATEWADRVCSRFFQKVMAGKLKEQEEVAFAKVLFKRRDQILAESKFKRDTCKVFMDWYEDERARRILESREDASAKLETLGKLIYGEEW